MKKKTLRKVMDREELFEWKLVKSSGGWVTLPKSKKIILKNYNDFSLFLHEVAHAKVCDRMPAMRRNHHDVIWADEYTGLVYKYTKPRLSPTSKELLEIH